MATGAVKRRMAPEDQEAWIDKVLTTYPEMANLPDPEGYNDIH